MSNSTHPGQCSQTVSEPLPLFLFPGMGGYDPKLVEAGPGALRAPKTRWQQLGGFSAAIRRGDAKSRLAYVIARHLKSPRWRLLLHVYARISRRWLKGSFRIYLERGLLSEHMEPLLRQWVARRGAMRPLPVPAYLFRTEQHSGSAPHHLGWDDYCPDLTVVSISGSHLGMLGSSNRPILCAAFRNAVFQVLGRPVPG